MIGLAGLIIVTGLVIAALLFFLLGMSWVSGHGAKAKRRPLPAPADESAPAPAYRLGDDGELVEVDDKQG